MGLPGRKDAACTCQARPAATAEQRLVRLDLLLRSISHRAARDPLALLAPILVAPLSEPVVADEPAFC